MNNTACDEPKYFDPEEIFNLFDPRNKFHLRVPKMSYSHSDWLFGLFHPRYGIRTWKMDGSNCWMVSAINTTNLSSLTSLTMATISKIFIYEPIWMIFGMIGQDPVLRHMASCNVIYCENLLVSRLTSLTMAAILEFFFYEPIWLKICILSLDELQTHMGLCYVVYNVNIRFHIVNLLDNGRHFENLSLWTDFAEILHI